MIDPHRPRPATLRPGPVAVLAAATVATGLTAGVFGVWAHTVGPALRTLGDRAFVAAGHALDAAILNPWFLLAFSGGPLLTGAAVVLCAGGGRSLRPVLAVALGLQVAAVVVTVGVHEPLNLVLRDPAAVRAVDPAAVRAAFDETRWAYWHLVRTVLTTLVFGLLAWALVLAGRAGAGPRGRAR